MKKKLYSILTMVCICLFMTVQPVLASGSPQLSASADTAKADKGQTVKVQISLMGNPKISTLGMGLSYDPDSFEYKGCSWSGSLGGGDMKMASGDGGSVNLSLVCDKGYGADGVVATVSFQSKKDGAVVDMNLALREMADEDLADVTNCKVTKAVRAPQAAKKAVAKGTGGDSAAAKSTTTTKAKSTSSSTKNSSTSTRTDESYKTGVLAGEDLLLVIAAACGLAAFIFWNEHKKGTLN